VAGAVLLGWAPPWCPTLLAAIGDAVSPVRRATPVGVHRFWRDLGYAIGNLLSGLVAEPRARSPA
jgi:hypothetical protein